MAELERRRLKAQVAPGRDAQDEPEVDVDEVPVPRDHDVSVVSVLGVQEVAGDGVAGALEVGGEGGGGVKVLMKEKKK